MCRQVIWNQIRPGISHGLSEISEALKNWKTLLFDLIFPVKKIRIKDIAVVKDGFEKEIEKEYIYSSHSGKRF